MEIGGHINPSPCQALESLCQEKLFATLAFQPEPHQQVNVAFFAILTASDAPEEIRLDHAMVSQRGQELVRDEIRANTWDSIRIWCGG